MVFPEAARLRFAGHSAAASILSALPAFVFITGLFVLLPRTGNESHHAFFKLLGKLPLLIRYFIIGFLFYALSATIKGLAG